MPRRDGSRCVRVVYALPDEQYCVDVELESGMRVADALSRSGLMRRFPELASRPPACAIYGQNAPLERLLRAGDRVEILRPLLVDPKENRRQAAARGRGKSGR